MNILWCGGEDISFPYGSSVKSEAGQFRSGYARCAICCPSNGTASSKSFVGGAVTSVWLSFYSYFNYSDYCLLAGLGNRAQAQGAGIWVHFNDSTHISISKHTGSTTTVLASASISITNGIHKFALQVIDYGATATVNLYYDSNPDPVCTYTGDIRVGTMTNMDCAMVSGDDGITFTNRLSEFIVADGDPRGIIGLHTRYPAGAGDANELTGTYADVDEITLSDSDYIYATAADSEVQFSGPALPSGDYVIAARKVEARAQRSASSTVTRLKLGDKISGGAYDMDAGQVLGTSWATHERLITTLQSKADAGNSQISLEAVA